jgi:hypothetical protein
MAGILDPFLPTNWEKSRNFKLLTRAEKLQKLIALLGIVDFIP